MGIGFSPPQAFRFNPANACKREPRRYGCNEARCRNSCRIDDGPAIRQINHNEYSSNARYADETARRDMFGVVPRQ